MVRTLLSRFKVTGYRSCKNTEISFSSDITALIGPNGAGKTNLLHALMLFGQPGPGHSKSQKDVRSQRCQVEVDFLYRNKLIQYRAQITYQATQSNRDAVIFFKEAWNFTGKKASKIGWMSNDERGLIPHKAKGRLYFSVPAKRGSGKLKPSDLSKMITSEQSLKEQERIARNLDIINKLSRYAGNMKYYSASQFTNPSLCPTSFEIDEKGRFQGYGLAGSTHLKFLYDVYSLYQTQRETYDLFLSLVDKRGVGLVAGFSWRSVEVLSETHEVKGGGKVERNKTKRILVVPTVKVGASRLSFNQLSEGTFRTLALIFYVVSDKNSLMIIEEPEVCVHHGLLSSVISILKEYSRTKQIIFSTHSEAVIDNLKPEQIRLLDYSSRGGTTVSDISSKFSAKQFSALKEYLRTVGNLGEFWRHSGF